MNTHSIKGVKSEDSLLSDDGFEIVTQEGDWPMTEVDGIQRPDILQMVYWSMT